MTSQSRLPALELLYEAEGLPADAVPRDLQACYKGSLGLRRRSLIVNFVSTIDGAVALPDVPGSVAKIRGDSDADPFIMGLLRAYADVLLIGASTFRASREARWVAESIYPPAAESYTALRRAIGRTNPPPVAVVTSSGRLDGDHPAFEHPAIVLTTDKAARRLRSALPSTATVHGLGERIDLHEALERLRAEGLELVICEGGPTLFGSLLQADLVDELFLTLAPRLAGHAASVPRLGLIEGLALLPSGASDSRLLSARRQRSHLYLRYALKES
jgi:riboflavin biosynthesis pyrimidine reductase